MNALQILNRQVPLNLLKHLQGTDRMTVPTLNGRPLHFDPLHASDVLGTTNLIIEASRTEEGPSIRDPRYGKGESAVFRLDGKNTGWRISATTSRFLRATVHLFGPATGEFPFGRRISVFRRRQATEIIIRQGVYFENTRYRMRHSFPLLEFAAASTLLVSGGSQGDEECYRLKQAPWSFDFRRLMVEKLKSECGLSPDEPAARFFPVLEERLGVPLRQGSQRDRKRNRNPAPFCVAYGGPGENGEILSLHFYHPAPDRQTVSGALWLLGAANRLMNDIKI